MLFNGKAYVLKSNFSEFTLNKFWDYKEFSLHISSFLVVFEDNIVTFGEKFKY